MNMFVLNRARARTVASAARNVVVPIRPPVAVSQSASVGTGHSPIRATWTIDPASGRLQCRWVDGDEATESPGLRQRSTDVLRPRAIRPRGLAA